MVSTPRLFLICSYLVTHILFTQSGLFNCAVIQTSDCLAVTTATRNPPPADEAGKEDGTGTYNLSLENEPMRSAEEETAAATPVLQVRSRNRNRDRDPDLNRPSKQPSLQDDKRRGSFSRVENFTASFLRRNPSSTGYDSDVSHSTSSTKTSKDSKKPSRTRFERVASTAAKVVKVTKILRRRSSRKHPDSPNRSEALSRAETFQYGGSCRDDNGFYSRRFLEQVCPDTTIDHDALTREEDRKIQAVLRLTERIWRDRGISPDQERLIMNSISELEEDLCPGAGVSKRILQQPVAPQPPLMPSTLPSPPGSPLSSTPIFDHVSFFKQVGDHLSQLPPGTPPTPPRPTSPKHFQPPPPSGSPTPDPHLRTKQLEQWLRELCPPKDDTPTKTNGGLTSPSRLLPSPPRPSSSPRAQGNAPRWSPTRPPPASAETPILYNARRLDQIVAEDGAIKRFVKK